MTRAEIITMFRADNPKITENAVSTVTLCNWCLTGDKEICAFTRCVVNDGETIETTEDDTYIDLVVEITNFYDIDEYPGGGVLYNNKRIKEKTMAQLDEEKPTWRDNSAGTPKAYYRRGNRIYWDRPIDSNEEDAKVYAVLISDDFDDDIKSPFNEITYLEPFHPAILKYLEMRAKAKVGKPAEAAQAEKDYWAYVKWMKGMISGGRTGVITFEPPC